MTFERNEFSARARQEPKKDHLEFLKQAAIHAEYVTNDPHWDKMLSLLSAEIDIAEESKKGCINQLLHPLMVNHGDIMKIKISIAALDARISALKTACDLPKTLKISGEKASKETSQDGR